MMIDDVEKSIRDHKKFFEAVDRRVHELRMKKEHDGAREEIRYLGASRT